MNRTSFLRLLLAALPILSTGLSAAPVSWSTAAITSPAADVSTSGTLVGAMNVGAASAKTINGVTFATDTVGNDVPLALGSATVSFSFGGSVSDNDFWAGAAPGSSADYDKALDFGRNTDAQTTGTLTADSLTCRSSCFD